MALEMQSKRFFIAPIWMARLAIIACVLIIGNWFVFIPWKLDLIMLAKKDFEIPNCFDKTSTFIGSSLLAIEIIDNKAYSLFLVSNI